MAAELSAFLIASQASAEGSRIVFAGVEPVSGPGELLRIYPGVGPDKMQLTRASFNGLFVARYRLQAGESGAVKRMLMLR